MPLLSKQEVADILLNLDLYDKKCFFIIESKTKTYDESVKYHSLREYVEAVHLALAAGNTVIVKNLEHHHPTIKEHAQSLGADVDAHMYVVASQGGSSFDFHTDSRDVQICMVYGRKYFILKAATADKLHVLQGTDQLFIPQGVCHKAIPQGPSCLLSFGIAIPV